MCFCIWKYVNARRTSSVTRINLLILIIKLSIISFFLFCLQRDTKVSNRLGTFRHDLIYATVEMKWRLYLHLNIPKTVLSRMLFLWSTQIRHPYHHTWGLLTYRPSGSSIYRCCSHHLIDILKFNFLLNSSSNVIIGVIGRLKIILVPRL